MYQAGYVQGGGDSGSIGFQQILRWERYAEETTLDKALKILVSNGSYNPTQRKSKKYGFNPDLLEGDTIQIAYLEHLSFSKKIELYTYEGDDHNLSNSLSTALKRSVDFFDKYLK